MLVFPVAAYDPRRGLGNQAWDSQECHVARPPDGRAGSRRKRRPCHNNTPLYLNNLQREKRNQEVYQPAEMASRIAGKAGIRRCAERLDVGHRQGTLNTLAPFVLDRGIPLNRTLTTRGGVSRNRSVEGKWACIASYIASERIRGERASKSGRNGRICGGTLNIGDVGINNCGNGGIGRRARLRA